MRIFEKGNWSKDVCPICNTQKEGKVTLVAIYGTQDGYNCEAKQVHIDCLDLWIDLNEGYIFQLFKKHIG
jgi:hypothetical protein